jgi:tetratricopeptide (TPR) repeat protein
MFVMLFSPISFYYVEIIANLVHVDFYYRLQPAGQHRWAEGVLGKLEEAIECCNKAIDLNPYYAIAWYNKACFKVKMGYIDKGIQDLKKAIELDKKCIEKAKQDKDFETIRNDDRFKKLFIVT